MKFGSVAPREALGAVAVHSVRTPERLVKKGTKIGEAEIAALERAGVKEVVVAQLEPGDVSEDMAAATLAAVTGAHGVTGEVRLDIELPANFPEQYRAAVIRAAEQCAVKKHLERVHAKMGVETRTAAAAMAIQRVRQLESPAG